MPITKREAVNLANHLADIRPAWTAPALMSLLESRHDHPAVFADIAAALCAAARDPLVKTPGLAFQDPRFWPVKAAHRPKPELCPSHPEDSSRSRLHCQGCRSEYLTGDRPRSMMGKLFDTYGPEGKAWRNKHAPAD